ncbi:2OG-Fe(II) oxygenase family protein [Luteimonas sp. XNQY3]|nr:2OG-Fe(II) oxygenase family protein [Luteimonas sp. XNQY3]MCD9006278.1 2OG-Fe(II) oxygenase family protein [Luteimonas sp. XNQY3]
MNYSVIQMFEMEALAQGQHSDAFCRALFEHGVFYVREDAHIKRMHDAAMDVVMDLFQNGTLEQKQALTNPTPRMRRGFSALEAESTAKITNGGQYTDYSMVYSVGLGDNLFPSAAFEQVWQDYFNALYARSQTIAAAVLRAAGADAGQDLAQVLDCDPLLRFRYFPEVPADRCAEQEPRRMAPHYDLSIITLIQQTPCANGFVSLQCEIDGQFVDIPPVPGAMVVFCGAVAPLLSNGRIRAPRHQVASPPMDRRVGSSRTSSVLFLRPTPDFEFSVPLARASGLDVEFTGDTATFGDWIGGNYRNLRTAASPVTAE